MAIDTTVAGASANSYATVAEANSYFNSHWSVAKADLWNTMSTPQKERLLKTATSVVETLRFLDAESGGSSLSVFTDTEETTTVRRYAADQHLSFPRNVDVDSVSGPFIPQDVKDAQCEQAVYLIAFDESPLATLLTGIIEESVVAGSVRSYTNYGLRGTMVAPMALELLRPYLRNSKRMRRA